MIEPKAHTVADNGEVAAPPPLSLAWRLCRAARFGLAYAIGGGVTMGLLASAFPGLRAVFTLIWLLMVVQGIVYGWARPTTDGHERGSKQVLIVEESHAPVQTSIPSHEATPPNAFSPSAERRMYMGVQWVLAALMSLFVLAHLIEVPSSLAAMTGIGAVAIWAPVTRRWIARRIRYFPRWISAPLAVGLSVATVVIGSSEDNLAAKQAGFASLVEYRRAREHNFTDSAALAVFDAKETSARRARELDEAEKKRLNLAAENQKKLETESAKIRKDDEVLKRFKSAWRAQDGSSAEVLAQKAKENSHFSPRGWKLVHRQNGADIVSLSWARKPTDTADQEYTYDWLVKPDGTFEPAHDGDKVVELGWQPFVIAVLDDEETYGVPDRNTKFSHDLQNLNFVVTPRGKLGDLLKAGGCSLGDPVSLGYVSSAEGKNDGHWRLQLSTNCKSGPAYFAKDGVVLFEKVGIAPWTPASFFAKRIASNPIGSWFKNADAHEEEVFGIARKGAEQAADADQTDECVETGKIFAMMQEMYKGCPGWSLSEFGLRRYVDVGSKMEKLGGQRCAKLGNLAMYRTLIRMNPEIEKLAVAKNLPRFSAAVCETVALRLEMLTEIAQGKTLIQRK